MFSRSQFPIILWPVLVLTLTLGFIIPSPARAAFTDTGISLTGVRLSSAAWGDYDNDGDLDILLTGEVFGGGVSSKLYRNNGGTFAEDTSSSLTGVCYSSAAWGDYDNDGDLDILLTGYASSILDSVSKIYRNDGGMFTEDTSSSLTGVRLGSATWGDYDNDGDLDILLTGDSSGGYVSKIYCNDGGIFTEDTSSSLPGVDCSSVAWGDYDNDGDLDILLMGQDHSWNIVTRLYRNNGGIFTQDTSSSLTGVATGSAAWGDYDNDGDLDILLTGESSGGHVSKIYRNDGGGVDFAFNAAPTAPANLESVVYGQTVVLLWDAASDAETPSNGLTYNIRVGTASEGGNTVSPMADGSTGWRLIPAMGRTGRHRFTILKNIDPAKAYYWSVQAVDTALEGSAWSSEMTFAAAKTLTVITVGSGSGAVTSNPAGIDCGIGCSGYFTTDAGVTLTATADTGSEFVGWWGGGCSGVGYCTVTMDQAKTVIAVFEAAGADASATSGGGGGGGGCFVDTSFSGWRP